MLLELIEGGHLDMRTFVKKVSDFVCQELPSSEQNNNFLLAGE